MVVILQGLRANFEQRLAVRLQTLNRRESDLAKVWIFFLQDFAERRQRGLASGPTFPSAAMTEIFRRGSLSCNISIRRGTASTAPGPMLWVATIRTSTSSWLSSGNNSLAAAGPILAKVSEATPLFFSFTITTSGPIAAGPIRATVSARG